MRTGGDKILNSYGQEINPATEDKQDDLINVLKGQYDVLIDDYTTPNMMYIGKAPAGSSESDSVWQISALNETGNYAKLKFADGDSSFSKKWDDRTTYSY